MGSEIYIVRFFNKVASSAGDALIKYISELLNNIEGNFTILKSIRVYEPPDLERTHPQDYKKKIAFSGIPPLTRGVYKLEPVPIYIDKRYTTVFWGNDIHVYIIFEKDDQVWNLIRPLCPLPDKIFNPTITTSISSRLLKSEVYVDTSRKQAAFDYTDFIKIQ